MITYKVWAQIEKCDSTIWDYTDTGEPEQLGEFDTLEEAQEFLAEIEWNPWELSSAHMKITRTEEKEAPTEADASQVP